MTKQSSSVMALLFVALSFGLTLHALAGDSFWGDEILTASFASQPIPDVIAWTASDIHPPLYYLVARTFTALTGAVEPGPASDWLWRFTSVIAATLTTAITYRIGLGVGRLAAPELRHPIALSGSLLIAVAPLAIKYGQEARMHALFMLLTALTTWLLLRAINQPDRRWRWFIYGVATAANIYTMYFGFLVLAAHGGLVAATLIERWRQTKRLPLALTGGAVAAVAIAVVFYGPWWSVLFGILAKRAAVGAIEGGVGDPVTFINGVVEALGPLPLAVAWGYLLLYTIGVVRLSQRHWPLAVFGVLWLGLPIALPIVLGDPRALQFRYAFILPVYLPIIALGMAQLARWFVARVDEAGSVLTYLTWALATMAFLATLGVYQQPKPAWRDAAAYVDQNAIPGDIIIIAPLWDEGRFFDYYYRGSAPLLTPAALITNIDGYADGLRANGGRIWAVSRFAPVESPAARNVTFTGVTIAEPQVPVYEPELIGPAAVDLARQAIEAAHPWAAEAQAQGVLDPDPRTAQAVALQALGDAYVAAGQPQAAIEPYTTAVDIFPGWVNGYLRLADTHAQLGDLNAAAHNYQQAVAFNSAWQGPQADQANSLLTAGQLPEAVDIYRQITGSQ